MSTFVEDSGTGGMGDGNPSIVNGIETNLPLYEFDLHNPDIRNDYGSYYGSHHKGDKHRRGHGITIYHNKSILDAWWSSNNKIQPLKPVFWLGTYPKLVMFNFLLHTNTSNPIRFINKKMRVILSVMNIPLTVNSETNLKQSFLNTLNPLTM